MYSLRVNAAFLLLPLLTRVGAAPADFRGGPELLGYSPNSVLSKEDTHVTGYKLEPGQTESSTIGSYLDLNNNPKPQPIRGTKGGTDPGPYSGVYEKANTDKYAPPGTDSGGTINAQWSMGQSHAKLGMGNAGWSKQQNTVVMPDATKMAGVMMRLEAGGYRELHWHVAAEWALVLNGTARIQAVTPDGQTFIDDVSKGDVWFFPPGVPHSIQGLDGGTEFLLVFDDGDFSEDNTFLASELFAHNPKSVLAKNLGVDVADFDNIPAGELFIFPGTKAPKDISAQNVTGLAGSIPKNQTYSYHFSMQEPVTVPGGSVKIVDPKSFPIAAGFSAALVTVKPGAMREIHWHPDWTSGRSSSPVKAVQRCFRHLRARTHSTTGRRMLLTSPRAIVTILRTRDLRTWCSWRCCRPLISQDISLGQWLGLTPPQVVQDTLHLSNATLAKLKKEKQYIVQGQVPASNMTSK